MKRIALGWLAPIIALGLSFWLVASPILRSPYWGDDMGNSQIPMQFAFNGTQFWPWFQEQNLSWITTTGRYFPLSIIQGGSVFLTFTDRSSYKAYEFVILGVTVALAATLVGLAFRSRWFAFAAAGFTLCAIQMKSWYDPYWQFSGLQELVASLSIASMIFVILAVRAASWLTASLFALLSAACLVAAGVTYESSVFLVICSLFLLVREAPRLARAIPIAAALLTAAGGVLIHLWSLRSTAVVTNPAYQLSLEPHLVKETLVNQMVSAIPLSYGHFTRGSVLPSDPQLPVPWPITILIVGVFIAVMTVSTGRVIQTRRSGIGMFSLAALAFWTIPSIFVAVSARWQTEVQPGLGYIPVLFGALAVGWLCVMGVAIIAQTLRFSNWNALIIKRGPAIVFGGFVSILAAGVLVITSSSNVAAVQFPPFVELQSQRDSFAESIRNGLLAAPLPSNATVVRAVPDWWSWQNAPFATWYGAPSTIRFITPEEAAVGGCSSSTACYDLIEQRLPDGKYAYSLRARSY